MLRKLFGRLTYANVMSTIAVFGVLAGGTAYAANTVFSTDIVDGQVKSVDVGDNEIGSADVKDNSINTFDVHSFLGVDVVDETLTGADIGNGSLKDEDIAKGTFVNFAVSIGSIAAQSCDGRIVTGVDAQGDHLLLTPDQNTASLFLTYNIGYQPGGSNAILRVCNPTTAAIDDGSTNFNLLVFDAQ
jgi:hypothetical protein